VSGGRGGGHAVVKDSSGRNSGRDDGGREDGRRGHGHGWRSVCVFAVFVNLISGRRKKRSVCGRQTLRPAPPTGGTGLAPIPTMVSSISLDWCTFSPTSRKFKFLVLKSFCTSQINVVSFLCHLTFYLCLLSIGFKNM
jgi:hypothetical protein